MLRPTRLLAALGTVLVLTACAGGTSPGPIMDPAGEAPAQQQPQPALSLTCDDIQQAVTAAAGGGAGWGLQPGSGVGATDYFGLGAGTFRLSGGLECVWNGGEASLTVRVLPHAAAEWRAYEQEIALFAPQRNEFGAGSYSTCMGSGCMVDVLQGEHWIQVSSTLSKKDMQAAVSEVAALVSAATSAGVATSGEAWDVSCDALFPDEAQRELLGGVLRLDEQFVPLQPVMFHAAIVRSAGGHCYWRGAIDGQDAALRIGVVPNAAGAWGQHFHSPNDPGYTPASSMLPPAGAEDAYSACVSDRSCSTAVLSAGRWISVGVIRAAGGTGEAAAAVAAYLVQPPAAG